MVPNAKTIGAGREINCKSRIHKETTGRIEETSTQYGKQGRGNEGDKYI